VHLVGVIVRIEDSVVIENQNFQIAPN